MATKKWDNLFDHARATKGTQMSSKKTLCSFNKQFKRIVAKLYELLFLLFQYVAYETNTVQYLYDTTKSFCTIRIC